MTQYRRSLPTCDADAIFINDQINAVRHKIHCGKLLRDLLTNRFDNEVTRFRAWCRCNLDCSIDSAIRYLMLHENEDILIAERLVSLKDAFDLLKIDSQQISSSDMDEMIKPV